MLLVASWPDTSLSYAPISIAVSFACDESPGRAGFQLGVAESAARRSCCQFHPPWAITRTLRGVARN